MVADAELVRDRMARIARLVRDLESFRQISLEDFQRNQERQYAVLHALQLSIEASIEIATHICAADALGVPATYADAFELLAKHGVTDSPLTDRLRAMARFRNRIVHSYWELDAAEVHRIIHERLGDFNEYLRAVDRYLTASA